MRISDWSSDVCSSDLEAIARNRAGVVEVRDTRDGSLDGEGDALLGLEWRIAFGLGVYLHLHIGDVRHGINRQTKSAPDTKGAAQAHDCEDTPAPADRTSDDTLKQIGRE